MSESGNNSQQSAASSLSKELLQYCTSDSLSKEGLHEIIDQHDLTPHKNPHDVGDYQFFLRACRNKRVSKGMIRCLLEYFPVAISATNFVRQTPLHCVCRNPNVTVNIVQLLVDAAPDSVRSVDIHGRMPLHCLCMSREKDERAALEILKLLIEKCPESIRHGNNNGCLLIHLAGGWRPPEFCSILIKAHPGSERISDVEEGLPFHWACVYNTLATVEYLHKIYPDAINHTSRGGYPIHTAILGVIKKSKSFRPSDSLDIVKFLLDCDPGVKLQKVGRKSPLHYACHLSYNDSNIETAIEVLQAIYDAHPEAIEDDAIASEIQRYHQQVQSFLNGELFYSRQAKKFRLMTTPDDNGRLPLHRALQNIASLGSIKLLVEGNPPALQTPDNHGALPLHVACQHHESADVIQYLIGLDATTLDAVDKEGNTALHHACHGAKYDTIALLLEKYDAISVSKRNAHGKLPIDILWESNDVLDRGSVEYTESVFRLLKAYPEAIMVMNIDMQQQQSASAACPSQNGKKRKFGNEE